MYNIKTINNLEELNKVYNFFESIFIEDAKEHNEHYYDMKDRLKEMKDMLEIDNSFLMYIENNNNVIATIIGKNLDKEKHKITISVIAVDSKYRRKGLAKLLLNEFEKRCISKNIKHIDLGARYRACPLYLSMNYKPSLMIQINNSNIENIRNNNKYNLKELKSFNSNNYSYIIYEIDKVKEEYIKHFEESVKDSYVQYVFEKELK